MEAKEAGGLPNLRELDIHCPHSDHCTDVAPLLLAAWLKSELPGRSERGLANFDIHGLPIRRDVLYRMIRNVGLPMLHWRY